MMTAILLMIAAPIPQTYVLVPAKKLDAVVQKAFADGALSKEDVSDRARVRAGRVEWMVRMLGEKEIWHDMEIAEIEVSTKYFLREGPYLVGSGDPKWLISTGLYWKIRPYLEKP